MSRDTDLSQARSLTEANRLAEAWPLIERWLLDNPEDPQAVVVADFFHIRARNYPMAYFMARRLTELVPRDAAAWINLSQACKFMQREKEGERAAKHGLSIANKPADRAALYQNLASIYMDAGRFAEAIPHIENSLKLEPGNPKFLANLGMCQLAQHDWENGWRNHAKLLGTEERIRQVYCDPEEPLWDGSPGQTVLVYGEQGLGDEICFASMVPDAIDRCDKLILNVDRRLKNLFARSFPDAEVHGLRDQRWTGGKVDASLPISHLGEFFRLADNDFLRSAAYLQADAERSWMWDKLFESKRKPAIGIAWSGGLWHTGSKFRQHSLESLLPIFESVDAHWVSLQYRDASEEIAAFRQEHPHIDLVQYPHATLTQDYDDTAALVDALDHVVAPPTAVVHLAGALGTPCVTIKPQKPCWKFANGIAFHPGTLIEPIDKIAAMLRSVFGRKEAA